MTLRTEIRADILKTLMQEDRAEIRLTKDRIYTLCSLLTVSSFAVRAFLLGGPQPLARGWSWSFFLLIDVSFIVLLWALFAHLKRDLTHARKCLQVREKMIRNLAKDDQHLWDPIPDASGERLTIREGGLYWIVSLATVALLFKLAIVCFGLIK
jgi:hypothetical protein